MFFGFGLAESGRPRSEPRSGTGRSVFYYYYLLDSGSSERTAHHACNHPSIRRVVLRFANFFGVIPVCNVKEHEGRREGRQEAEHMHASMHVAE